MAETVPSMPDHTPMEKPFVDGLAELLPEGDLIPLGDERGRRLEEPAAERDAHAAPPCRRAR